MREEEKDRRNGGDDEEIGGKEKRKILDKPKRERGEEGREKKAREG